MLASLICMAICTLVSGILEEGDLIWLKLDVGSLHNFAAHVSALSADIAVCSVPCSRKILILPRLQLSSLLPFSAISFY